MWFRCSSRGSLTGKSLQFGCRRHISSQVRVRFAPSPTGFIHLGGLRTALYNFLFAKQNNGSFILRIEDTDKDRVVPGSLQNLEEMLDWTGLRPDEGPSSGGSYGPYIQSQRLHLYKENLEQLLTSGSAYRCFCSEIRLNLLRKEQVKNREVPKYDNRCRHLTESEVDEKVSAGQPFTVRLKMKEGPIEFNDLVIGPKTLDLSAVESDPVIYKSDGFPTYHFANVIDDHYMKISHVLRGHEWIVSTPKHLMLYEAFGWTPPQFAHLPLILNKDGTKLSKRQNGIRIDYYRDEGYYPETLVNYLLTIGGGFGLRTEDKIERLDELVKTFDVTKLKVKVGTKIDLERLPVFNRISIHWYLDNGFEDKLVEELKQLLITTFGSSEGIDLRDNYLKFLLNWSKERIFVLKDLVKPEFMHIWKVPELSWKVEDIGNRDEIELVLRSTIDLIDNLNENEFTTKILSELIRKEFNDKLSNSMKFSKFMKILRLSFTNLENGPPIAEVIEVLGQQKSIDYLINAINYTKTYKILNKSQV